MTLCVCGHRDCDHLHGGGRCDSASKQCGCLMFRTDRPASSPGPQSGHQCTIGIGGGGFRAACRCGWESAVYETVQTAGASATIHCEGRVNHFCANCGHMPDDHQPACIGVLPTIFGDEQCGCPIYQKDNDD